jgi:hypothetical protein
MEPVTLTVWMKHPTGVRWRKDATHTGTLEECQARVAKLYRQYQSTDVRCTLEWTS